MSMRGFSLIVVLLIILGVLVMGVGGYFMTVQKTAREFSTGQEAPVSNIPALTKPIPREPSIGGGREPEPEMVDVPTISIEAEVIFLSPDVNTECENSCPGYQYPKDTGVIKINKITSIDNPNSWDLQRVEEGRTFTVQFSYSSRPAKVRVVPEEELVSNLPPETLVSGAPVLAKPIPREDGYFIYTFKSTSAREATETVLPGLTAGSRFKAIISYSSPTRISIGKYELVTSPMRKVTVQDIVSNPNMYLDMRIQATGSLINVPSSHFTSGFELTDGTNNFSITSWIPIEVPPLPPGSSLKPPRTMQFYVGKTIVLEGIVKKDKDAGFFYLDVKEVVSVEE